MSNAAEPRYPYVHVDAEPEAVDELSLVLFELGASGVEERDATTLAKGATASKVTLVASFETAEEARSALSQLDAELSPRYEEVVGDAWRDAWKEHFRPFEIAPSLVVAPPWETYEARPGEQVLELEPGRAFGTGLHETTRLVARALHEHRAELEDKTVLDVGTGSGILALVATRLGARRAVAIDNDPEAVEVARENIARNRLGARVEASTAPLADVAEVADVVVANIEARVLVPLAAELRARVAPSGLLLLSGVLVTQQEEVRAAYPDMDLVASPALGDWVLLALRPRRSDGARDLR